MTFADLEVVLNEMRQNGLPREQSFAAIKAAAARCGAPQEIVRQWVLSQASAWPSDPTADAALLRSDTVATRVARRRAFLALLRQHGNVQLACDLSGLWRTSAYYARRHDSQFRAAWCAALIAYGTSHASVAHRGRRAS